MSRRRAAASGSGSSAARSTRPGRAAGHPPPAAGHPPPAVRKDRLAPVFGYLVPGSLGLARYLVPHLARLVRPLVPRPAPRLPLPPHLPDAAQQPSHVPVVAHRYLLAKRANKQTRSISSYPPLSPQTEWAQVHSRNHP